MRYLRGKEEGFVTKIISAREVEVEIEDGFCIPYQIADLVQVRKEEAMVFGDKPPLQSSPESMMAGAQKAIASKGYFMGFEPYNDKLLDVHLINNTDLNILYTFGEERQHFFSGLASGGIRPRSAVKVHQVETGNFERWPVMLVQSLFFLHGASSYRDPLVSRLSFKAATFFKNKKEAPVLKKQMYLFQIDNEFAPPPKTAAPDASKIKEAMLGGLQASPKQKDPANLKLPAVSSEVDLHIEKLLPEGQNLSSADMLAVQLEAFEKAFDKAISAGLDQITFIHGVGNGVLRSEIQRRLGQEPTVAFFKDAHKEKFGYGATTVKIK